MFLRKACKPETNGTVPVPTKTQLSNFLGTPGEDYFKGNPKSLNFYFLVIWWGKVHSILPTNLRIKTPLRPRPHGAKKQVTTLQSILSMAERSPKKRMESESDGAGVAKKGL